MDEIIPNYWPVNCFGCSPRNVQGLQLVFRRTTQGCVTRCVIPEHLCGFDGVVHGGIVCTLLDETAAWAMFGWHGRTGLTKLMTIRYLRPVPAGTELLVEAHVISHDENHAEIGSTVSSDGVLLAEAQTTWRLLHPMQMAKIVGMEATVLESILTRYQALRQEPAP